MEQSKSPFEEIFKREESRKKEEEKEEGILDALDNEEKSLFEESSESGPISLGEKDEREGSISKEEQYLKLLNDLIKKRFFEEAMGIIGEMKEEFGQ
jgi:hypothetical protein